MKKGITTRSFSLLLALILIVSTVSAALAAAGDTTHVSRSTGGAVGNGYSTAPAVSADGRYVAFMSGASNLVTGDTNNDTDVFVRDTQGNTTIRVSIATDGTESEFLTGYPSISADGRYVAFHSYSTNLVPNNTNGGGDVYVRDTQTNTTIIASLDHQGNFANLASSLLPSISADGRYVAFESDAILVPDDTNFAADIYVRDLQTNTIQLISVASDGTQGDNGSHSPAISADGRYVAFKSDAFNLVTGDTNGVNDIFLRDRQTNTTTRVSVATDGTQANFNTSGWQCPLAISGDGRYVVFESDASNLVDGDTNGNRDIFLRDTQTDATTILSVTPDWGGGNGNSFCPSISGDGRYVNFYSFASNLVANDTNGAPDVFVRDIQYGITQRVSVASVGTQATGWSQHSAISSDGSTVAFASSAINLVASVTGQQIFKHELGWSSAPAPKVIAIQRADENPTGASSVSFKVIFSQYVSGVDAGDFLLATSGVTGGSISSVSGSNNIYTVTVNTGSDSGTIRLDVVDNDSIKNAANSPLGGVGAGNGNFTLGETYTIDRSPIFDDVPAAYWAWQQIERLYNAGITGGCTTSPLNYCPESQVTRAQMAVFLERGLHYPTPYNAPDVEATFTDTDGHWAEDWIEALKNDGVTAGCAAGLYCPENPVTRAQMAVFLLKAKYGSSYTPPAIGATSAGFGDVPTTHWAAAWIKQLAAEQITGGCGGGNYCPESPVTRAQMAVFLVKTFNLP